MDFASLLSVQKKKKRSIMLHTKYFSSLFKHCTKPKYSEKPSGVFHVSRRKTVWFAFTTWRLRLPVFFVAPSYLPKWLERFMETLEEQYYLLLAVEQKVLDDFIEYNPVTVKIWAIGLPIPMDFYILIKDSMTPDFQQARFPLHVY